MRKPFLFLMLFGFYTVLIGQTITGTVLDKKTKTAVLYATVYFNGTFVGTTTDEKGNFELNISKNTSMPLTISAIGYYSVTLTKYSTTENITVYLEPKLFDLKEVTISGKSLVRKRRANLRLFKDEFLGTTANALKCEITNEEDIGFDYSNNDTLIAYASKPIQIINKALGYSVTYYLDYFEYHKRKKTVFFYGNIMFKEDAIDDNELKKIYENERKATYLGSRMHFFRALWSDFLGPNKFIIVDHETKKLEYRDIVVHDQNNKKYLSFPRAFQIRYSSKYSTVNFLKKQAFFDENGYFDPSGINWKGEMGNQRVGDWLPYEYQVLKRK